MFKYSFVKARCVTAHHVERNPVKDQGYRRRLGRFGTVHPLVGGRQPSSLCTQLGVTPRLEALRLNRFGHLTNARVAACACVGCAGGIAVPLDPIRVDHGSEYRRRRNPQSSMGYVSHETIYRALFIQARGELRHELTRYLRTHRAMRRPKVKREPDGRGLRRGVLTIAERPAEAADRAVPGHWQGDLLFGRGMSPVATLVERSTRFLLLVALPEGKRADLVADALAARILTLPDALRRTLTWDQG